jgi:hypothetical protein
MKMERRPDGSVDSFRSSHNRSRWQYATFIAALCHDLGKLFDLAVRGKGQTWCPLHEPSDAFGRRTQCRIGIAWLTESMRWQCPPGIVSLPVVDMNVRLPFNLIWKKDNSSPLLQKFVAQVQATRITMRD